MGAGYSNGFSWSSTADQTARDVDLKSKVVVVTGANTGIGQETARVLAKHGATVIIGCRDMQKGEAAVQKIRQEVPDATIQLEALDLSSLESVRSFAAKVKEGHPSINILVNNAGVMACPLMRTKDGFEMQFGTNHLGHFLLTNLLIENLERGAPARVVNLSSRAHEMGDVNWDDVNYQKEENYGRWSAYASSKTANVLFSVELNRRYQDKGITSNAVHPGAVNTELTRHFGSLGGAVSSAAEFVHLMKSANQGAATSVYCATAPELEKVGGKYFQDSNESPAKPYATNLENAAKLWEMSEKLVGLKQ